MRLFAAREQRLGRDSHPRPRPHEDCLVLSRLLRSFCEAPFDRLPGSTLADLLGIWDCESQRWVADGPIVVRLSTEDFLIWPSGELLSRQFAAIDTAVPVVATAGVTYEEREKNAETCLRWRRLPAAGNLLGCRIATARQSRPGNASELILSVGGGASVAFRVRKGALSTIFSGGPHSP